MNQVFIIDPVRTPVGKYGGALSSVRPDDLAALVIRETVKRSGLPNDIFDDVIFGCANQAGEDNRNVARMAVLLAGLSETVPAVTVNRLCASSLEAVAMGARAIMSGEAEIIIAGGVESMTRAPYSMPKNVSGEPQFGNIVGYDTALGWRYPNKKLEQLFPLESMGETAENVAEKFGISREDQDNFALLSHQKAVSAQECGIFNDEIVPVVLSQKKGDPIIVNSDEQPRRDSTFDKLSKLKPAFRAGGTVTAGNSSSLNDGAGAMILASESAVKKYNLKPYARYAGSGTAGVNPRFMGIGPVYAVPKALKIAGISLGEVGLFELNEAFASQSLACIRELGLNPDIVNPNGGAIAIGHPLGMSGARLVSTLVRSMQRDNIRYGVATLCIGVGQGLALVFEKV